MARLKDILLNWSARRITQHYLKSDSTANDVQNLQQLLELRNDEIKRLKVSDKNRAANHLKLKDRYREKQAESKQLQRRTKSIKLRLATVRERNSRLKRKLELTSPLVVSLHDLKNAPHLAGDSPLALRFLEKIRYIYNFEFFWKHWMRLGVLQQYTPRPMVRDDALEKFGRRKNKNGNLKLPSIVLVTPSYNQADYLKYTIDSVVSQDYPNLDYVVMDGGSTDGTRELLAQHSTHFCYWHSKPDDGQTAAIADGFKHSDAEIMGWLNSDDMLMPGTLYYVGKYFSEHPEVDVIYGHRVVINSGGNEIGRWVLPPHDAEVLLYADFIPQETCFWRRGLYEQVGGIDTNFNYAMDWDLILRFQKAGARFYRAPYFMGVFRQHEEQKTSSILQESGYPEMHHLRSRELAHDYSLEGLARTVTRAQVGGLVCWWLMRAGIRW